MKAKTVLDTASTILPIGTAIVTAIVAPNILLSILSAEAGYGALLYTIAFFGGAWGIAPGGVAATALIGTASGGGAYWVSNHLINDLISCVQEDPVEASSTATYFLFFGKHMSLNGRVNRRKSEFNASRRFCFNSCR